MAAVQASGSPSSQPDWSCITLNENVSVPNPVSGQALVRVFGSSVNPVNVDLVEPTHLRRLRVFRGDHWHRHGGRRRRGGRRLPPDVRF